MPNTLFADIPKRSDLLGLSYAASDKMRRIRINIFRNHSFEMVESVIASFAAFAGFCISFDYSDYDDSLNFNIRKECDLNLIWLDLSRYKNIDLEVWLRERAAALRLLSKAPILVCCLNDNNVNFNLDAIADSHVMYVKKWIEHMEEKAFDLPKQEYSGTRLSSSGCIQLARVIAMKYIPAMLQPALKAIVVDLDNTLYDGILGEDGIDGLKLTPMHETLQQDLKKLGKEGFFLCISSKNEEEDVLQMFRQRSDFPLKQSDFTIIKADWNSKAENIIEIAKKLNIGTDAMLFIDDNPAEIQNVEMSGIDIHTVLAESSEIAVRMLRYYPGLLKLSENAEDSLRAADVRANEARKLMKENLTQEEYFKKLGICLTYTVNNSAQIPRIAELFGKTNQFICSYKRYNQAQVKEIMDSNESGIITISMSDNLSDSGIIAIIAASIKQDRSLMVDELVVSCRALGRNIEDAMLLTAFRILGNRLGTSDDVLIGYRKGERNTPALQWLNKIASEEVADDVGIVSLAIPSVIKTDGISIIIAD